jgi:diaminopimelate decarboxylase
MTKDEFFNIITRTQLLQRLNEHETPCYIYFLDIIKDKIKEIRTCLSSRFSIHYAVKANPHHGILQTMAEMNLGADVASSGELEAALAAGIKPNNI